MKMIRIMALLILIVLLLAPAALLMSCDSGSTEQLKSVASPEYPESIGFKDYEKLAAVRRNNQVSDSQISAINAFAFKTSAALLADAGVNSCYSPLSLYLALSMAATGAIGTTQAEMLDLLGSQDTQTLADECSRLFRLLYADDAIGKLKLAQSAWMDNDLNGQPIKYKDAFISTARDDFYASLYSVDFAAPETGDAISQWIADNTGGLIKPKFVADPQQILSIINTIYFYDQWTRQFARSLTKPDTFHLADGSTVTCDFMNAEKTNQHFARGEGFLRADLSLKHNGSMSFILPDEDISLQDLLTTPQALQTALTGGESVNGFVTWSIPKFSIDSEFKLKPMLKSLGMNAAFDSTADFSGITDSMAFISNVIQQTHIAINEDGVEAAAYTRIDLVGAGAPVDEAVMILNRPFIFTINAVNGTILFIGICGNPNAQ